MREKIIIGLAIFAAGLLAWNMNTIFTGLPDELNQGAIYRIIYFHVPANILGMTGFGLGMLLSIGYLVTKDLRYDALAASVTEVSLVFASIGLATGSIWARIIWGVWWAWDVRLTSWLVCWLIFGGYLMLRRAVDEPIQRARFAAVVSVLGSVNAYISYKSIEWWNTQHPAARAFDSQRRRHGCRHGSSHLVEPARSGLLLRDPGDGADAPGIVRP